MKIKRTNKINAANGFTSTGDPDPTGMSEGTLRWANKYKTWQDVYSLFIEAADKSNNDEDIESEVYKIYQKGKGLPQFEEAYTRWMDSDNTEDSPWKEVASKQVMDSDGFLTDYTMYTDGETYICMFGDKDIYEPDIDYADYETDGEKNAWDWFNTYEGFADDFNGDEDYDVYSSEEVDDESDELDHPDQEFDSAKTSINSNKLPAVYRMISIPKGTVGVDFGGGSFDNAVEHIRDLGATLCVYDPYNRSAEHNKEVIKTLRANGGADWAVNSNVLNVIKEPEARRAVLENISKITKSGAPIYITVYEGRGDGKEGQTKSGYQLNRKTQDYLEDIQEVFPDAKRRGKLITAHNTRSANSSVNASDEGYVYTYCDGCGKKNRVKVSFKDWKSPFDDTEYDCEYCGAHNLLTDPHIYDDEGHVIESARDYGGAYDIDPSQYFTREDINEFAEDVVDAINRYSYSNVALISSYVENDNIEVTVGWDGNEATASEKIDMRKIRTPRDINKYAAPIADELIQQLKEVGFDAGPHFSDQDYPINEATNANSISTISSKIKQAVKEVMTSPSFGFEPEEIDDYSAVEVDPSGRIEVRAEVDYDGLMDLCDALNPIVEQYDKHSYFEPVEPGIIEAYIHTKSITSSSSTNNTYDDRMTVSRGGQKFSVHYNHVDNSPSADVHQMWKDFKATVSPIKPYDDAEYAWANIKEGKINVVKNGRVIEKYYYFDADDMDIENIEWCDAIIEQAIDYISKINDKIEPRIIHTSKDTEGQKIEAGIWDVPEPNLDPPEYDEPTEEDPFTEYFDFYFDSIIIMDKDGGWDYENDDYSFAANPDNKQGDWRTDEDNLYVTDTTGMVEYFDEMIEPMMPADPGRYRIEGYANMAFDISGVEAYYTYYRDGSYDRELVENGRIDAKFNFKESEIKDFKYTKLD